MLVADLSVEIILVGRVPLGESVTLGRRRIIDTSRGMMKSLVKRPGLRGMRGAVLATSLACAAASAALVLATEPHASDRLSAVDVALDI